MKKIKMLVLIGTLIISIGAMVFFVVALVLDLNTTRQGQAFFEDAALPVFVAPRPDISQVTSAPLASPEAHAEQSPLSHIAVPHIDFDAMRQDFPSIIGWLQSAGTNINYPLMQGTDNVFYLHHLPDGTRNRMGSIFLDYRHSADFSHGNFLIYGHNMASGDKFASLRHYASQAFFDAHSSLLLMTPEQNFLLGVVATYTIDSTQEHPPSYFIDETHFDSFMADVRRRSPLRSDLAVSYGDQLVFLVTCIYADNTSPWRRIVVARLIDI